VCRHHINEVVKEVVALLHASAFFYLSFISALIEYELLASQFVVFADFLDGLGRRYYDLN
jgi:hypothetical protein